MRVGKFPALCEMLETISKEGSDKKNQSGNLSKHVMRTVEWGREPGEREPEGGELGEKEPRRKGTERRGAARMGVGRRGAGRMVAGRRGKGSVLC